MHPLDSFADPEMAYASRKLAGGGNRDVGTGRREAKGGAGNRKQETGNTKQGRGNRAGEHQAWPCGRERTSTSAPFFITNPAPPPFFAGPGLVDGGRG
eukprot:312421-Rhodomonas_salina.1